MLALGQLWSLRSSASRRSFVEEKLRRISSVTAELNKLSSAAGSASQVEFLRPFD
jgi:hypothetical protein